MREGEGRWDAREGWGEGVMGGGVAWWGEKANRGLPGGDLMRVGSREGDLQKEALRPSEAHFL